MVVSAKEIAVTIILRVKFVEHICEGHFQHISVYLLFFDKYLCLVLDLDLRSNDEVQKSSLVRMAEA